MMDVDEQTFSAAGIERVSVELERRDITIEWSESTEIVVQGDGLATESVPGELFVTGDGGLARGLRISLGQIDFVSQGGRAGGPARLLLPLTVAEFRLRVRLGDVHLRNARGQLDLHVDRGDVSLERGQGQADIAIGSGALELEDYQGSLSITGGSGDKELRRHDGPLMLASGSGDVDLIGGSGEVRLTTGAGDVDLRDRDCAAVQIKAGSGDVKLQRGRAGQLSILTGSGDIDCDCGLGLERHSLESGSGDIKLGIPRDLSARIEATTTRGKIESQVPLVEVGQRGKKSLFGRRLVGSVGEGAERAEISLRTASGDIALRWLQPAMPAQPQPQPRPEPQPQPQPSAPRQPWPADEAVPLGAPSEAPAPQATSSEPAAAGTRSEAGAAVNGDARRRVLEALAAGTITPAEAARLLDALERTRPSAGSGTGETHAGN